MRLYHGSNVKIERIDLRRCNLYKDFGKAFYLTEDKEQALAVAKARVSLLGGDAIINEFEFNEKLIDDKLKCRRFDSYSEEWADFIFQHRDDTIVPPYQHEYDVVFGPIANDRVGMQIRNFKMGHIDKTEFLRRLQYMKGITFQWAFCTPGAISCLKNL